MRLIFSKSFAAVGFATMLTAPVAWAQTPPRTLDPTMTQQGYASPAHAQAAAAAYKVYKDTGYYAPVPGAPTARSAALMNAGYAVTPAQYNAPVQGGYPQAGQPGQYPQQQQYAGTPRAAQGYPQQPAYPQQAGYPPQGFAQQPGYPQPTGYPQQGYPQQAAYPQQGYPQQTAYPQSGYPQQTPAAYPQQAAAQSNAGQTGYAANGYQRQMTAGFAQSPGSSTATASSSGQSASQPYSAANLAGANLAQSGTAPATQAMSTQASAGQSAYGNAATDPSNYLGSYQQAGQHAKTSYEHATAAGSALKEAVTQTDYQQAKTDATKYAVDAATSVPKPDTEPKPSFWRKLWPFGKK